MCTASRQHFVQNSKLAEMLETFGRNKFPAQFLARKTLALNQTNLKTAVCETNRCARACHRAAGNNDFGFWILDFGFHFCPVSPCKTNRAGKCLVTETLSSPACLPRCSNSSGTNERKIESAPS